MGEKTGRQTRERLTELNIKQWRRTAKPGDALNDGGGLHLRRQSLDAEGTGRDYWFLRYTSPETGKRGWLALWDKAPLSYPAASTAEARQRAQAKREALAAGTDPLAQRRRDVDAKKEAARQADLEQQRKLTIRQLFDRWAETMLTPRLRADGTRDGRKDGGQYAREQFERRVFPALGSVPAVEVRKADLLAILDAVKAEGKLRTSNVLLADLKQMLRFAVAREIILHNPLEAVTKRDAGGKETERARVLAPDEVKTLARLLQDVRMGPRSKLAVWLILATGCRIGELMGARWEHVDFVASTWHLPETKNERKHTIHLSSLAILQFKRLEALRESDAEGKPIPWVFPNMASDGPVCVKSFGKQLADRQRAPDKRMQHRSKATGSLVLPGGKWTAHDLRRTAATLMASLGISGDVIDECLNHKIESRVRRTYITDRRPIEQARAFDALGARLETLLSGEHAESNVVPLKTA